MPVLAGNSPESTARHALPQRVQRTRSSAAPRGTAAGRGKRVPTRAARCPRRGDGAERELRRQRPHRVIAIGPGQPRNLTHTPARTVGPGRWPLQRTSSTACRAQRSSRRQPCALRLSPRRVAPRTRNPARGAPRSASRMASVRETLPEDTVVFATPARKCRGRPRRQPRQFGQRCPQSGPDALAYGPIVLTLQQACGYAQRGISVFPGALRL